MLYALLFISTILITNSLHSMEIVKKNRKPNSTFTRYLLIQKMGIDKNIPKEISNYIIQYHVALQFNHLLNLLKNENRTIVAWDNAHIPINYYLLLSSIQVELINEILLSPPRWLQSCYRDKEYNSLEQHYFLQSEEDYQLFLTLPIKVRKHLAQAPKPLIKRAIDLQKKP